MTRLPEIVISQDHPYQEDQLNRGPIVDTLSRFIKNMEPPYVLALDGAWGSGKTTLVKMLIADLRSAHTDSVYFDAWRFDYMGDPLIALVAALVDLEAISGSDEKILNKAKALQKLAAKIALTSVSVATRYLSGGLVGKDELESIQSSQQTFLNSEFESAKKLNDEFTEQLESLIQSALKGSKGNKIVFFIDELDRCRPDFAIRLLERVKHFFDITNIFFVLVVDKAQLEASIKGVYGSNTDATEYLRKFIDFDYRVRCGANKSFTTQLMAKFGLSKMLEGREGALSCDESHMLDYFTLYASVFNLSARAQLQCFGRLAIVLASASKTHYLDPIIVSLLIVLRSNRPELYEGLINGKFSAGEFMSILKDMDEKMNRHEGNVLHGYLLAMDPNTARADADIKVLQNKLDNTEMSDDARQAVETITAVSSDLARKGAGRRMRTMAYWHKKIELHEGFTR